MQSAIITMGLSSSDLIDMALMLNINSQMDICYNHYFSIINSDTRVIIYERFIFLGLSLSFRILKSITDIIYTIQT